jgi:hypothetical protein
VPSTAPARPTGIERLSLVTHRGVELVLLDFVDAKDPTATVRQIHAIRDWFGRQTPQPRLRTVTDVTGARYNAEVLEALKELATHNKPFVGAAAGVVKTALHRVALNVASMVSGRNLKAFASRDEAMDWVAQQAI